MKIQFGDQFYWRRTMGMMAQVRNVAAFSTLLLPSCSRPPLSEAERQEVVTKIEPVAKAMHEVRQCFADLTIENRIRQERPSITAEDLSSETTGTRFFPDINAASKALIICIDELDKSASKGQRLELTPLGGAIVDLARYLDLFMPVASQGAVVGLTLINDPETIDRQRLLSSLPKLRSAAQELANVTK
jgi:hypothetical protein